MAKKIPMYLKAFRFIIENPKPFRDDEYLTMCRNMSEPDELPVSMNSQELKELIIKTRHLIISEASYGVLELIKKIRTQEAIPRSQFWWYPDDTRAYN